MFCRKAIRNGQGTAEHNGLRSKKETKCEFNNGTPPKLIIIDYGAKTLTYETMTKAGTSIPLLGQLVLVLLIYLRPSPARASAPSHRGNGSHCRTQPTQREFRIDFCAAPIVSKPCVTYTVGPQKF